MQILLLFRFSGSGKQITAICNKQLHMDHVILFHFIHTLTIKHIVVVYPL